MAVVVQPMRTNADDSHVPPVRSARCVGIARFGETLARDAQKTLAVVAEGVVHVARPNDDARAGARGRERAARLERHDDRVLRQQAVLRDEARTIQPRLLAAREHRVHVVRARIVTQRREREDDDGRESEIVRGAQMQLVAARLERREIERRPLANAQRLRRADPAVAQGVVHLVRLRHVVVEHRGERGRICVVADEDVHRAREERA